MGKQLQKLIEQEPQLGAIDRLIAHTSEKKYTIGARLPSIKELGLPSHAVRDALRAVGRAPSA